jgi:hypothetical protein
LFGGFGVVNLVILAGGFGLLVADIDRVMGFDGVSSFRCERPDSSGPLDKGRDGPATFLGGIPLTNIPLTFILAFSKHSRWGSAEGFRRR